MAFLFAREPDPVQETWLRSPEAYRGHPTAPGPRDEYKRRAGGASPGNGQPGVPRFLPTAFQGPGLPGATPNGPIQPDVVYDNPYGEDKGDT